MTCCANALVGKRLKSEKVFQTSRGPKTERQTPKGTGQCVKICPRWHGRGKLPETRRRSEGGWFKKSIERERDGLKDEREGRDNEMKKWEMGLWKGENGGGPKESRKKRHYWKKEQEKGWHDWGRHRPRVRQLVCIAERSDSAESERREAQQILSRGEIALLRIYCFMCNWVQLAPGERKSIEVSSLQ